MSGLIIRKPPKFWRASDLDGASAVLPWLKSVVYDYAKSNNEQGERAERAAAATAAEASENSM